MNQVLVARDSVAGERECRIVHLAGALCGILAVMRGGAGDQGGPRDHIPKGPVVGYPRVLSRQWICV